MTATNHILSGAIIGAVLPLPIALPVAFASHFALDALPHFGIEDELRDGHFIFKSVITTDAVLSLSFLSLMLLHQKWGMIAAALAAFLPDLIWIYKYSKTKSLEGMKGGHFTSFHLKIQNRERPWAIAVELGAFYVLVLVFFNQFFKT